MATTLSRHTEQTSTSQYTIAIHSRSTLKVCVCRFIQKQGLDRTFVECDNHMWRVDNRKLPGDITVDGGSDWIVIHRNYSHYLVTDQSRFLTGLRRYYEFSLLPAEVCVCVCVHI